MRQPAIVEGALTDHRLRPGPKQIVIAGPVLPGGGLPTLPIDRRTLQIARDAPDSYRRIQRDLARVLRQIATRGEVDDRYYRTSLHRGDALLHSALRVMHLHLLHPGSDVLLDLIQTTEAVLLLELGPHHHLEHVPPGKRFNLIDIRRAAQRIVRVPTVALNEG